MVLPATLLLKTTLRRTHLHVINKESGGHRYRVCSPGIKDQGHRLTCIPGQRIRRAKAHLLPGLGRVGVASLLQFRDYFTITTHQVRREDIPAGMSCTRGITIPPVTHRDISRTIRYCKVLGDTIVTTTVTAEIRTVASTMRIRRINDFISTSRGLLP